MRRSLAVHKSSPESTWGIYFLSGNVNWNYQQPARTRVYYRDKRNGTTIAIDWPGGDDFFCQEHDAIELLAQAPDYVNDEDYLLWYLDSTGALGG